MTTTQTEVESQIIELSTKAFRAFCDNISKMCGVDMSCKLLEPCPETVSVIDLKRRFEKLVTVISVKSEGLLEGTYQFIFDMRGLFTLSGVIVMLPEKKILYNSKYGSAEDAERMSDTIGEVGNLLVGSWDRVFREKCESHGHFAQFDTFVGNPLSVPVDKIGVANDEELLFALYEMTIGPYPPFNCGVIFPRTIFGETSVSDAETPAPTDEKSQEKLQEKAQDQQIAAEKVNSQEPETPSKGDSEESKSQAPAPEKVIETGDKAASAEKDSEAEKPAEKEESAAEQVPETATETKADDADTAISDNAVEPEQAEAVEPAEGTEPTEATEPAIDTISGTIQRIVQSPADLPGEHPSTSLAIRAKDIMQKKVIWGSANDSIQQALTKMQQADVGYMMVGTEGQLDGIVSKSDITGAVSVYLRPVFAKWRRPIDDATLQIKIKWIMIRPVRTIKPDTSFAKIIENMCQFGMRCLPVVDSQGKVVGSVTVFDIFKALLNTDSDTSTTGKTLQAPPLA